MNFCTATCADPWPGEQEWACEEPVNHRGPHRMGRVMWSSGGSEIADRHAATNGGDHA